LLSYKKDVDETYFCITVSQESNFAMPNILPFDKQVSVVSMLAEGASIRGIERMTGVHRDTVMRLGARVGDACADFMDGRMRELNCRRIEVDELWGFIAKKQAHCLPEELSAGLGDVYTFVALDADTKLVPSFMAGRRNEVTTHLFLQDLQTRLNNRVQLSSDGWGSYAKAVDAAFGGEVDYGQIVKVFASPDKTEERRYSPPPVSRIERSTISGEPDEISTSYVEKQNHTVRMHCRRLSRLTNAFSKKLDNFKSAVALHFAYYNFVRFHKTIRCTPAMAAGVERSALTVADLVALSR
jgi:IS1 family transposase